MSSQTQSMQRGSSISQTSRSFSNYGAEMDATNDNELVILVNDLKFQINIVKLENEILENTILRLEPTLMHGVYQALEFAKRMNSSSSFNVGSFVKSQASKVGLIESLFMAPSKTLTSPSRGSTRRVESTGKIGSVVVFGSGARINVLERSELVSTEMEVQMANLEKSRKKAAKQHALLRAQLEEIDNRVTDFEKANKMFKQDVLIDGWDKIAQRIPAEIWIRFMNEWTKLTDSQIGKLRLRTSTLNTHYSKLKGQIKVKTELSESLRPVDFDKLKIENSESLKLFEKKLLQLSQLKEMTGDANLNLAIHKKAMMEQNCYLAKVLVTIKNKEKQTVELDKEANSIHAQADILEQRLHDIRKLRMKYKVPDVMDYVKVKSEMTDLRNGIKTLENRVHIQQIALTSINKTLQTMANDMEWSSTSLK